MMELLLADIEWGKVVIFIIFVLGPLLSQLGKGKRPDAKMPKRGVPPVGGPPPPRKPLDDEIADFLRQAQRNANPPQAAQPQPTPQRLRPQPQPVPQGIDDPRRRGVQGKPKPAANRPKQQPAKPAAPRAKRKPLREEVGQHVTRHIDTSSIQKQSEGLGGRLHSADENVEQHLHDVFDHQIGDLDSGGQKNAVREGTDDAVWDTIGERQQRESSRRALQANDIMRMLRNPIAVQEAIVLAELLKPPISERSRESL